MERLLVLMTTTTYKAQAFLDAAERLGVEVVVGTNRRQVLSSLNPRGNLTLPFANLDEATERILESAKDRAISGVVAADDDGVVLAARAARALGLAHNPEAAVVTSCCKLATRESLGRAGLDVPDFRSWSVQCDPRGAALQVEYPCVLKPLDLSGSRGVIRADGPQQFVATFRRIVRILDSPDLAPPQSAPGSAQASGRQILVESFIPGFEVALEGLLTGGRLRPLALFDKPDPLQGPFFEETIYVTPSRHRQETREAVVAAATRAVEAIGLREGPVHVELRVNDAGPWVLEVAPRSIGGLCARALRFGAGDVSLEELILRHALGRDTRDLQREARASGVMMIPIPRPGILRKVGGLDDARSVRAVEDVRITIPPGQPVQPPPEGSRYLGFIFARAETPEAVEEALRASHAQLHLTVETLAANHEAAAVAACARADARAQ